MSSLFISAIAICMNLLAFVGIVLLLFTTLSAAVIVFWGKKLENRETGKKAVRFTSYVTIWCLIVAVCLKYIFLS